MATDRRPRLPAGARPVTVFVLPTAAIGCVNGVMGTTPGRSSSATTVSQAVADRVGVLHNLHAVEPACRRVTRADFRQHDRRHCP